jgi:hypothetical protein
MGPINGEELNGLSLASRFRPFPRMGRAAAAARFPDFSFDKIKKKILQIKASFKRAFSLRLCE